MKTSHKIILGDSRRMRELEDSSVHLVVTSPPYWQLKDYGHAGQVGYNDSYEEYINHLNLVWRECGRVLLPGCRLCVNIGDQFARAVYYGRYKIIPIRTEIIKFCENAGFDYMGAVIWRKVTTTNTSGGAAIMGSYPYPRSGILKLDYEFILLFRKYGDPPPIEKEKKEASKLAKEEWNQYFSGHWNFPGMKQKAHLAMFPEELPRRLIKMFSFVGDTVLDPFLGSGTTSLAAKNLGRNSVGYEIREDFLPLIQEKVKGGTPMFDEAAIEIVRQENFKENFAEDIKKLPYVFQDAVRFERKIDPKKFRFGSKIDRSPAEKETYYSVREVLGADRVVLSDGRTIRLLGVQEDPEKRAAAIAFLKEKTKGQRVFVKPDPSHKGNKENANFLYLYLKNKTFLNAHLIKQGLANPDRKREYKHKKRFLAW